MTELIPLLSDLLFVHCGFVVPDGFAESYVKLHENDWNRAQDHWERFVQRVLDSDRVEPYAQGERAMKQAVAAASSVLHETPLQSRCPRCVSERRRS
ncbi:DUF6313 family protein [Sphaerisporangium sp. B11E5]|uniref:DUF6313 family protein n=1 Tax=Sphaerisporangium sp. B11E5 TaxID=3153563 RepID=UPI00325F2FF9